MSKSAKKPAPADEPSFEQALAKLESIVESMEGDELELESLLARFEEGTRLAALCQQKLAAAELKIQQLTADGDGTPQLEPFEDAGEPAA